MELVSTNDKQEENPSIEPAAEFTAKKLSFGLEKAFWFTNSYEIVPPPMLETTFPCSECIVDIVFGV